MLRTRWAVDTASILKAKSFFVLSLHMTEHCGVDQFGRVACRVVYVEASRSINTFAIRKKGHLFVLQGVQGGVTHLSARTCQYSCPSQVIACLAVVSVCRRSRSYHVSTTNGTWTRTTSGHQYADAHDTRLGEALPTELT